MPPAPMHDAPVHNGVMELLERKSYYGQVTFLDCAIFVALQRLAQEVVGLTLHRRQFLRSFGVTHLADQVEQIIAMLE